VVQWRMEVDAPELWSSRSTVVPVGVVQHRLTRHCPLSPTEEGNCVRQVASLNSGEPSCSSMMQRRVTSVSR